MFARCHGVTLIELMVTVLIIGLLAVVAVPYTMAWKHQADLDRVDSQLRNIYSRAKAEALKNAVAATDHNSRVAGLRRIAADGYTELRAFRCSNTDGSCATIEDVLIAEVPASVEILIGAEPVTSLYLNSRGRVIGQDQPLAYTLSKGNYQDDASRPPLW